MINIKAIGMDNDFSDQISKATVELSNEMSRSNLNCKNLIFIMQGNDRRIQKHVLEFEQPTNNFKDCANLLVGMLNSYKDSYNPQFMCLQVSKLSVAV